MWLINVFWALTNYFFAGGPHLTQDEILNYSHEDFEEQDEVDNGTPDPPMTDDNSSDESEIDLASPYDEDTN